MMLENLRRLLHQRETRRKNQGSLHALDQHLRTDAPVLLVHQMGRAGSMTTVNSLRQTRGAPPVYHTHWLNDASLQDRQQRVRHLPEDRWPLNVRIAARLAADIAQGGLQRRHWHIISVFREPVGRNVSTFFLSIERFFDDFFERYGQGEIGLEEIRQRFLDAYRHEQPLQWFDREVNDVFGIDVYDTPFDHERGYSIRRAGHINLLLLKLERLNETYQCAFQEFMGLEVSSLSMTHVTEQDPSFAMYRDFVDRVVMPQPYLDQMYSSKFARHFYTPEELSAFRAKWSRST